MLDVRCPGCGTDTAVAEAVAGFEINCPSCNQPFIAGTAPAASPSDIAGTVDDPTLAGIGGWLILPAIGLVIGPLLNGYGALELLEQLLSPHMTMYEGRFPGLATVITTEITATVGFVFFQLLVALMFFRRKAVTPVLMVILLAAGVLWSGYSTWMWASVLQGPPPEVVSGLFRSVLSALIWIPYFLLSVRVKATFVNR